MDVISSNGVQMFSISNTQDEVLWGASMHLKIPIIMLEEGNWCLIKLNYSSNGPSLLMIYPTSKCGILPIPHSEFHSLGIILLYLKQLRGELNYNSDLLNSILHYSSILICNVPNQVTNIAFTFNNFLCIIITSLLVFLKYIKILNYS